MYNESIIAGDVNLDEIVNIQDLVLLVNFVLENDTPTTEEFSVADINQDGVLNVIDVVLLVNEILWIKCCQKIEASRYK